MCLCLVVIQKLIQNKRIQLPFLQILLNNYGSELAQILTTISWKLKVI
jgi:hypothetical protein